MSLRTSQEPTTRRPGRGGALAFRTAEGGPFGPAFEATPRSFPEGKGEREGYARATSACGANCVSIFAEALKKSWSDWLKR